MNTIHVELIGTSPIVHNRCWSDGSGRRPTTDFEQAEGRLFRDANGLYLPWNRPLIAIGRAAHSRGVHGAKWPMDEVHASATREALFSSRVDFEGEWEPHVFRRVDLPPVALPRFDRWSASFAIEYDPAYYDAGSLRELLEFNGHHLGMPQFAPFAGAGPWGLFSVEKWEPVASVAAA